MHPENGLIKHRLEELLIDQAQINQLLTNKYYLF